MKKYWWIIVTTILVVITVIAISIGITTTDPYEHLVFYYISIDCALVIVCVLLLQPWKTIAIVDESKTPLQGPAYNLEISHLITRSGHLEAQISGLRTGTSILLTVGTGLFLWIIGQETSPAQPVASLALFLAPFALVVISFIGFILSFTSIVVRENGHQLSTSLLPNGLPEDLYKKLLVKAVKRREEVLAKVIDPVRSSIIVFFIFVLWAVILIFLPSVPAFMLTGLLQLLYGSAVILALVVSFIIVIMVNRYLKLDVD